MTVKRMLLPLAALAMLVGLTACPAFADEPADDETEFQIKQVDQAGRVKLEVGETSSNRVKLVPFPEDLEEPEVADKVEPAPVASQEQAQQTADTQAERRAVPPSTFRPRFRTPAVRQAQHLEPVDDDQPAQVRRLPATASESAEPLNAESSPTAESSSSTAESKPAADAGAAAPQATGGKALIESAFAKSKVASEDTQYTEIIDLCRRATDEGLRPKHEAYARQLMSWAYNRRGEAHATEQRQAEALADFDAAIELNPQSFRPIHNRALVYVSQDRVTEALADFEHAIKLNPQFAPAYFNRGELMCAQGHLEEALRDYTSAIDLGSPDVDMYVGRGHANYRLMRFDHALDDYNRALKIDPANAAALVNRGDAYCDMGRYADAAADYRAAVRANPNFGRAYQAAAWLMATCADEHFRNAQLAINAAKKAIALDGEEFHTLETLAAAQASAGQFGPAKETQEKAIAKAPRSALVAAEKRMALYQRDLAFREQPPEELIAGQQPHPAAGPQGEPLVTEQRDYPVRRASAELPEATGGVMYPEEQPLVPQPGYQQQPRTRQWTLWPKRGNPEQQQRATSQSGNGRPRMLPKPPTHPLGRN